MVVRAWTMGAMMVGGAGRRMAPPPAMPPATSDVAVERERRHVLVSPSPSASEGEVTASEGEVRPWWCGRGRWER